MTKEPGPKALKSPAKPPSYQLKVAELLYEKTGLYQADCFALAEEILALLKEHK
jgi:hypothetical protein